jgi:Flp pilus assembly pilin Flp
MKLMNILKKFSKDEAGAVTVDWVVLTAAIVGLGLVVMQTVSGGLTDAADSIVADLDDAMTEAADIGGAGGGATPPATP